MTIHLDLNGAMITMFRHRNKPYYSVNEGVPIRDPKILAYSVALIQTMHWTLAGVCDRSLYLMGLIWSFGANDSWLRVAF